ncbi:MAG: 3-hydroxyacyl-CoA dehydrogenase family protein [Deltaproteobacteria bacterium]|nr:3-hydroxyacyl-CoA dehydrogenase family protein [Deltaproteobacteria bacterium]
MIDINRVVVIGANGTMGAGSAEVFAAGGCEVVLLARSTDRAREGLLGAQNLAKSEHIADRMSLGTYEQDFEAAVSHADLIFEALAEDIELKRSFFERVDRYRRPESLVATVSSGLSIAEMARGRSASLQRNFLGIHLFNPPNVIVGTEVIPHAGTDPALVAPVAELLERRFGRVVTVCRDLPAFAGNRVGFKVLNEVAQLAAVHGVAFMDYLIGPYTGRALAPLATIDLVGWDVHRAIVDNVYAHTRDEAHAAFALPPFMARLIEAGHLGNKSPARGGFYRRVKDGAKTLNLVLDPGSGEYKDRAEYKLEPIAFVEQMRELHRIGCYADAAKVFARAEGAEAELARQVVLGYVSYALNRVGGDEVVSAPRDVDRIMGFGFNWAPPTVLVDLLGLKETTAAIERCGLQVPRVLMQAKPGERLFREPNVNLGRFFAA